jgi:recombination protein RecR
MNNETIQKLITLFSKFPTIGPRTATRFVFYLIKLPQEKIDEIIESIKELKSSITICPSCFNPFESSDNKLCSICRDESRDKSLLCIVEKETDLITIEKTNKYKGLYFILGETINLRKKEILRMEKLKEKIKDNNFQEIIIALSPTTEGETTRLLIERELNPFNIKTTHLGRGLPVGGEVEYADPETLSSALEGRK